MRERGLGAQPLRVVAGRDQQRGCGVGADPGHCQQRRRGLSDQPVQLALQGRDLGRQLLVAHCDRSQRQPGRLQQACWPLRRFQFGGCRDQVGQPQTSQLVPQLLGGGHHQRVELVGGLGAGLDRRAADRPQGADHLHLPIGSLGLPAGGAGLDRPGGRLGVGRVRLARPPLLLGGPVDLDHGHPVGAQEPRQPDPVAARALHARPLDHPEPACPAKQLGRPGLGCSHRTGAEPPPKLVQRHPNVHVGVGVHPQGHLDSAVRLGRHGHRLLLHKVSTGTPTDRGDGHNCEEAFSHALIRSQPTATGAQNGAPRAGRQVKYKAHGPLHFGSDRPGGRQPESSQLHFLEPIGNPANPRAMAQHYIGWGLEAAERISVQTAGGGAAIVRAVQARAIGFVVAATWPGTRSLERQLKNRKCAPRYCPVFRQQRRRQ